MKNILLIISGSKQGSTIKLVDAFIEGVDRDSYTINKVYIGDKTINGCQGCDACQSNHHQCSIHDDMQQIYSLFNQCDILVMASPLYFWTISAKLKAFIERLYALSSNDAYPNKQCMFFMSAGDDQFWTFEQPLQYYHFLIKALGWKSIGEYMAGGCKVEKGIHLVEQKHLQQVQFLAKKIQS